MNFIAWKTCVLSLRLAHGGRRRLPRSEFLDRFGEGEGLPQSGSSSRLKSPRAFRRLRVNHMPWPVAVELKPVIVTIAVGCETPLPRTLAENQDGS